MNYKEEYIITDIHPTDLYFTSIYIGIGTVFTFDDKPWLCETGTKNGYYRGGIISDHKYYLMYAFKFHKKKEEYNIHIRNNIDINEFNHIINPPVETDKDYWIKQYKEGKNIETSYTNMDIWNPVDTYPIAGIEDGISLSFRHEKGEVKWRLAK